MSARDIAAAFGDALGRAVEALGLGDTIRAHYAAKYGTCRRCAAPLGGPSPEQVCEHCHAGEVVAQGFADGVNAGEEPEA